MSRPTALVTGGAGFIGSHLVDALLGDGHRVVVVDDLSTGTERNLDDAAELEVLDIVDRSRVDAVVDAAAPDVVYHLAAQASVTASVDDPARDCAVNVQGTLNVLEACRRHRAPLVFASTGGALYGNDAPLPTPEDRIPAPLAPYGASKWAGEAYVSTWAVSSGAPHAVCRLANIYGPRQNPHGEAGVVAIFTHRLWRGEAPVVYGHGRPSRDYVHVSDVASAMRRAAGRPGVFNVATARETAVIELLDKLQSVAGTSVQPILAPLRPGELERSCMDPSRAAAELGWRAQVPLERGLESTYHALVREFELAGEQPVG
jgi:UDP-glucose 4-epimerase